MTSAVVRALAVFVLLSCVTACGKEEREAVPDGAGVMNLTGLRCAYLAEVVNAFGSTIQGPYSSHPLRDYGLRRDPDITAGLPQAESIPPDGEWCSRIIGQKLAETCSFSEACQTDGGSFEACLVHVEAVFSTPGTCTLCGDGVCTQDEYTSCAEVDGECTDWTSCPDDCSCGNGICEPDRGEWVWGCPTDCTQSCGDNWCSHDEYCGACEDRDWEGPCVQCDADCCNSVCGDGICAYNRDPESGIDYGETVENCEQDCGTGWCGDGACLGNERAWNCRDCPLGDNCLNTPGAFTLPYERCGDGVCEGCEVWTCASDCADAGFAACARDGDGVMRCPPIGCGDGECDLPIENNLTCPLDCVEYSRAGGYAGDGMCSVYELTRRILDDCNGSMDNVVCGDGYCGAGERGAAPRDVEGWVPCPEDCDARERCPAYPGTPQCVEFGAACVRTTVPGPVTGTPIAAWAKYDCTEGCDGLTPCADRCTVDEAGARCIDCSYRSELDVLLCGEDREARCVDSNHLETCVPDSGNPEERGCDSRVTIACPGGCVDGACLPCEVGTSCGVGGVVCMEDGTCGSPCGDRICHATETITGCPEDCATACGNAFCDSGETAATCPGDCACRDACFVVYGEETLECPEQWAACACGTGRCDPWEQAGEWACPEDCGGR